MFAYGQTAANAIAVMSYLAAQPSRRAGSGEIARARGLSRAFTAKLLTQLASAQFLSGQPGPGGGYMLAKSPSEISLFEIACLFEQMDTPTLCPFGPGWCGNHEPCPLHDRIHDLVARNRRFLEETRLSVFQTTNHTRDGARAENASAPPLQFTESELCATHEIHKHRR